MALDHHLSELERVGAKINATDMTSDFDVEHIQKLLTRFTECGQGVSTEVASLSGHLREAQQRAEGIAQGVARQADLFYERRSEQNEKLEHFRVLGEKVGEINAAIAEFRRPKGAALSDEDRAKLKSSVPAIEARLASLIGELQELRHSARDSKMRGLEKNAESLSQTLQAVQKKLGEL
jgi:chromosome segregation ATPase